MNKVTIAALILLGSIVLGLVTFYFYAASVRDTAVKNQETVKESWGNVQSAYQRRADLIGNLVETVRAAAENERQILLGVTEARGGIGRWQSRCGAKCSRKKRNKPSRTSAKRYGLDEYLPRIPWLYV